MTDAPHRSHAHGNTHEHEHEHGHEHGDDHEHPGGVRGYLRELFMPHTHDAADSVDDALEASARGVRALKISLFVLLGTTGLQLVVVFLSNSVALLADTVHNFADALTAVPLWIAFVLARRAASRRYPYGYGRAEDLAGLVIIAVVAASAIVAAWQAIDRLLNPQPVENLGWLMAAGVIGFLGNEAVAIYRIRVGRQIGSAALVADGVHARTDGFTSLAVVLGVTGVWLGFPLADPIIGLLISIAIFVLLIGTARDIGRRLLDGVDPDLVTKAETALGGLPGVVAVPDVRMRWNGHRLTVEATIATEPAMSVEQFHRLEHEADHTIREALPSIGTVRLNPTSHASKPEPTRAI